MSEMEPEEETSRPTLPYRAAPSWPVDAELILRVRQREEAALGALYDRYGRLVYTIALRITSDHALAEEVVQDVFQALWQAAGSFQPERSVVAWLIAIARHSAIDATRTHSYRARGREVIFDEAWSSPSESTEMQATTRLLHQEVRQALTTLPAAQRQTLELAYYQGLSSAQIATQLATPVGTVKSRMRLGLLKLRDALRAVVE